MLSHKHTPPPGRYAKPDGLCFELVVGRDGSIEMLFEGAAQPFHRIPDQFRSLWRVEWKWGTPTYEFLVENGTPQLLENGHHIFIFQGASVCGSPVASRELPPQAIYARSDGLFFELLYGPDTLTTGNLACWFEGLRHEFSRWSQTAWQLKWNFGLSTFEHMVKPDGTHHLLENGTNWWEHKQGMIARNAAASPGVVFTQGATAGSGLLRKTPRREL